MKSWFHFPEWFGRLMLIIVAGLLVSHSLAQEVNNPTVAAESSGVADPPTPSPSHGHDKVKDAYVIGADDVLAINVWRDKELSRVVPVRPDGNISLPLVNEVQASGLTAEQLQARLSEGLRKYLDHPEVTVIVQEAKSHHFNVVGEVQKPSFYLLSQPLTVLDAIALAGGFRDFAKRKKIYVLRAQPDGSEQRIAFNYNEVIKGRNVSQNILLQPGDTLVIP
jgi:polysaccharide export outer membrane protein